MAAKPKGGMLLIGIGPKKPRAGEKDSYGGDDETGESSDEGQDDSATEVKRSAARALMSALKSSDVDAFIEAFDAFKEADRG